MSKTQLQALNRAIAAGGGLTKFAKMLGVVPSAVQNWRARGVPSKWVIKIETATQVPRRLLRPDLYP